MVGGVSWQWHIGIDWWCVVVVEAEVSVHKDMGKLVTQSIFPS